MKSKMHDFLDEQPAPNIIADLLHHLMLAGLRYSVVAARQREIKMRELLALGYLRDDGGITPSDLSETLGITTASVTALIDRLARVGYVRRQSHPRDRRSVLVTLTEAGTREVRTLFDLLTSDVESALSGMAPAEQQAVGRFLQHITGCFEQRSRDTRVPRDRS
jgi:DNA-binding MarR family transcriptional regulator